MSTAWDDEITFKWVDATSKWFAMKVSAMEARGMDPLPPQKNTIIAKKK